MQSEALQQRLGHVFRDRELLRLALTHPSVLHGQSDVTQTNQRLEFLGDAVISLVLTHAFYDRYPDLGEGALTKARAKLVNRRALAARGRGLALGAQLILSPGEEKLGGRDRTSALADAYEAVVGAIFLDGGFAAARAFVLREFSAELGELDVIPVIENPKGELQELLQARSPDAPRYQVTSASGPDHDRDFECVVQHGGVELARGRGKSKKEAETAAALAALAQLRGVSQSPSSS
jgi:ribonuclease-3